MIVTNSDAKNQSVLFKKVIWNMNILMIHELGEDSVLHLILFVGSKSALLSCLHV